ncbi:MAG: hypothetical protein OEZ05_08290 [Nitrospirota bacterium]|nr:hypothetical protein [Nitrospirota bacterium]MDH5586612.1 hypothetical protein [Nitrospirota bacterium]
MRLTLHGYLDWPMNPTDRKEFDKAWSVHQDADWPDDLGSHEGQLMTLDTVIGGCLTYFCQEHELDPQRVEILRDCLAELESVVEDVAESPSEYFRRLQFLGTTLLQDYS